MQKPLDSLVALLDLEEIEVNLFRGRSPEGDSQRVFGGQVLGQALVAAGRTVDVGVAHSFHAYFLRPGRYDRPIRFVVDRIRDGRSFTTRRVVAHQAGEAIFNMAVSFARPEQGLGHQRPMPQTPPPDGLQEWSTLREGAVGLPDRPEYESPIEVRVIDPTEFDGVEGLKSERQVWIRPRGKLPDDPALHTATLVYATDWTLLSTVLRATSQS